MYRERNMHNFVNELPKDTGLANVQHCKIKVTDIFPDKFCEITNSYVRKLQGILCQYEAVIFMARKAVCFYRALLQNEELYVPASCKVYSSRILSYNIWDKIQGKRIALIDDVIIRGGSLNQAKKALELHNVSVDIFISALMCQSDSVQNGSENAIWYDELIQSIQKPFVYLSETDIYSYANYITRFIEASMLPYNIDQPTVLVGYSQTQLADFMHEHRLTDISSSIQKKFGIENQVIHYSGEILRPVLGSININLDEVCIKIRIFHDVDSRQLLIFPIILFPIIPTEIVDHVYEHIRSEKLDQLIHNDNFYLKEENKIKLLLYVLNHYILSRFLWCEREHGRNFVYLGMESNESILFSESIMESDFSKSTLRKKISNLTMPYKWEQKTTVRPTFFNEYLGAAYALIFTKTNHDCHSPSSHHYVDAEGNQISKKIYTLQFLLEKLQSYARSKQCCYHLGKVDEVDICIVSNIIDVLIDRGILVPEIVYTHDGGIVRAFRCGEVAKLNEIEFILFSYMLTHYSSHKWQNNQIIALDTDSMTHVDKREVEQLCVLFFRKAAKCGLFETISDLNENQFEDDVYSIYYSLFGPTVSRQAEQRYEVNEKDTLIYRLTTYGYVQQIKHNGYSFEDVDHIKLDKKWKRFALNFANEMLFLKHSFPSSKARKDLFHSSCGSIPPADYLLQKNVFSKVRAFGELLTLMSIGENEMQRTLSIVAEIKIIAEMKTERVSSALSYFMNHMDCIWEGIWKSSCYVKPDLLEDIQEVFLQGKNFRDSADLTRIFQEYVDGCARVDHNEVISNFLRQCGEFFYRTYYTVYLVNKYITEKVDLEAKCKIPNRFKYEKQYKALWDTIEAKYKNCESCDLPRIALNDLIALQRESMAILDICDLYLKHSAFGYETYHQAIIICANTPDILSELQIASRGCNFNQSKTGKIGESRFFRCFLVEKDTVSNLKNSADLLSYNIDMLICNFLDMERDKIENAEITVIYYDSHHWYESLFFSGDTCAGKFVELIVKDVTRLERKWRRGSEIELFVCGAPEGMVAEMLPNYFRIIDNSRIEKLQNYITSNYQIHMIATKNKNDGSISINGDVNGNVIGSACRSNITGVVCAGTE